MTPLTSTRWDDANMSDFTFAGRDAEVARLGRELAEVRAQVQAILAREATKP